MNQQRTLNNRQPQQHGHQQYNKKHRNIQQQNYRHHIQQQLNKLKRLNRYTQQSHIPRIQLKQKQYPIVLQQKNLGKPVPCLQHHLHHMHRLLNN